MADLRELIKDYLNEAKLMQLATVKDNKPWVCNVWFAADENLNIYWFSSITRRHSHEVEENPNVAAAMVTPHTPEENPRGLQVEGTAIRLTQKADIDKAIAVFADRIYPRELIHEYQKNPEKPHHFYRLTPSLFVLFDTVNFPHDSRQEYRP